MTTPALAPPPPDGNSGPLSRWLRQLWDTLRGVGNLDESRGTVVSTKGTQTLENKTLTAPTINDSPSVSPCLVTFGSQSTPANTNTNFLRPVYKSATADTAEVFLLMPFAGTIRNLYFRAFSGSAGAGTTITLRKNGIDTALVISLAIGATTGSDTTHEEDFSEGDELSLKIVHGVGIAGGIVEPYVTAKVTQA